MSWAIWDFNTIFSFGIFAAAAYVMSREVQSDMAKERIDSRLAGLFVAVMSSFFVGAYFIISVAMYFLIVTIFNKIVKIRNKTKEVSR